MIILTTMHMKIENNTKISEDYGEDLKNKKI